MAENEKYLVSKNLKGYGSQRIYGFLAERFSHIVFFSKYNYREIPMVKKDLSDYKNLLFTQNSLTIEVFFFFEIIFFFRPFNF